MRKQNKQRQQLLQRKRTKRNQSRKGVKYDPNKMVTRAAQTIQAGAAPGFDENTSGTVFKIS